MDSEDRYRTQRKKQTDANGMAHIRRRRISPKEEHQRNSEIDDTESPADKQGAGGQLHIPALQ